MQSIIKNKYLSHKETIHNFVWRFLQIFGKEGINFLIFVLCAKMLLPYEFGIYNYVLAVIYFLVMFGDFGISTATSKYVAEYNILDKDKLKTILFSSGVLIFVLTIIITILTLILGPAYLKDKFIYILYLLPLIFLVPMTSLYDGIYRGLKRFKILSIIFVVTGVASMSFVYILTKTHGLIGALLAQNLFYLILLIVLSFGYRDFYFKINREMLKEIGNYGLLVGLSAVGLFLYTRADIIILGYFGLIKEIAYYEIINKIFQILILPVMIIATVIAPNTTKNFTLSKFKYIKEKLRKEIIFLFISGLFVSIISYLIFPYVFKSFLPEYNFYLLNYTLIIILIIIPFRFFSTFIGVGYITPMGLVKITTITLFLFGILNIFLDFILINKFGYIGVMYATLISQLGHIFSNSLYFYFKLNKLSSI